MEFDQVVVKQNPGLCRCCLSEGCYKDLGSEYTWMGETEVYAEMLLDCFDIGISQHSAGPNGPNRLICEVCITRLRDACNFKKQVVDSEKKFIDMLSKGELRPKVSVMIPVEQMKQEPPTEYNIECEYLKEDYMEEDHLDDDMGMDDDEDSLPLALQSTSKQEVTAVSLPTKRTRGRPRKQAGKEKKPKLTEKKPKLTEKKTKLTDKKIKTEDKDKVKTTKEITPHSEASSSKRRNNLLTLFNNTSIIPFKWRGRFRCFYCSETFVSTIDLRKHTQIHGQCTSRDHSIKIVKGGRDMEVKIDISVLICNICKESYSKLDDIIEHLVEKHKLEFDKSIDTALEEYKLLDFSCHLCDKKFTYFGFLVSHMNTCHPKNCHICEKCNQKFNKRRDLFSHIKNYHREGGYKCEFCPHKFSTLNILRKHKTNIHLTRCEICYLKLPSAALKTKHMEQEHPDDGSLQCVKCNKEFHTKQGLKMHLRKCREESNLYDDIKKDGETIEDSFEDRTVRSQNVKKIKENIVSVINMSTAIPFSFYKNKFNCFYCSEDFTDSDCLREHSVMAHHACDVKSKCIKKLRESNVCVKLDISSLACKVCFESMDNLDALIDHLITKHNANYDKSITTCLQPYRLVKDHMACPFCPNEVFRFFGTLLKHINSTHTENNIICVHCGQTFRREQNLRVHIWRHHKDGQFKCSICDAECFMPSRLYMHMAKVHGKKAAKCSKCDERFTTQYLRQKHMIEAHDMGHMCSFCGKLFVRNSFMKDHVRRTHLKEKNVECNVCNMKFFNNILLRRHMVKHSGEKNFHCDVCGERFFWRKGLVRHMGRHNKTASV